MSERSLFAPRNVFNDVFSKSHLTSRVSLNKECQGKYVAFSEKWRSAALITYRIYSPFGK